MGDNDLYDIIIVGLGPAGLTAAVYAYRKKAKTLLIGKNFGGGLLLSGEIENWPGVVHTTGVELAEEFKKQIKNYCSDISCFEQVLVSKIEKDNGIFKVHSEHDNVYRSYAVIYATGRKPRKLGVPGEEEYRNKGVAYCTTCDGPLFSGKEVMIIGGGNSALEGALMMRDIASRVTLVTINSDLEGDAIYIDEVKNEARKGDKLSIIYNGNTKEIKGDGKFASGAVVEDKNSGETREISAQGIFVEIGSIPIIDLLEGLGVETNSFQEIKVNKEMETSIVGLYAAGDVTDMRDKQLVVAAGAGCTATLSTNSYLARVKQRD